MKKYQFKITYSNKNMQDVSRFMRKLDMEIGNISQEVVYGIEVSDKSTISQLKELLKEGLEQSGCVVYAIEGWEIKSSTPYKLLV